MNDKYAKKIAKELRLIRIELQKRNEPAQVDAEPYSMTYDEIEMIAKAGERVTIK